MQKILLWLPTMCWHLWLILRLKPGFKYLSDTPLMVTSFSVLYGVSSAFLAGAIGMLTTNELGVTAFLFSGAVILIYHFLYRLLVQPGKSKSLFAVTLAVVSMHNMAIGAISFDKSAINDAVYYYIHGLAALYALFCSYQYNKAPELEKEKNYRYVG